MLSFNIKKQLRDFTVDIHEELANETLVLIGHSGCGKSTTLKMIAGLTKPDAGEIFLGDTILYGDKQQVNQSPEERNIGFVFQNYALFPHLSVRDNVLYGISRLPKEEKEQRLQDVFAFLGIEALAESKPAMLSGGEQQRVALARALVTKPKLLLLDEPLSALDVSTRSFVRTELKELLTQLSIPAIIVTHDYEDARVLADKVAVMDRGEIIQTGRPSEISQFPVSQFVAEFTSTNLVQVPNETRYVAFDPWKVELTRDPGKHLYAWAGSVRDISHMGGFVRIHITGVSSFFADIPVDIYQQHDLKIGEHIYGVVRENHVRQIEQYRPRLTSKKVENVPSKRKKLNKRTWAGSFAAVLLFTLIIQAVQSSPSDPTGAAPIQTEMMGLIAANATDPFNELATKFEETHPGVNMEATFAGTQVIRTQLEQGANADLFLSADLEHIQAVKSEGLIDAFFPVSNNHVVIVVPKDNPANITSLQDLSTNQVKLVIGTDTVPIGKYTRKIFSQAQSDYGSNFSNQVMDRVVSLETNVKQVLQKVALGEAEAGLVYVTDVTADFADQIKIINIPEKYNVVATNYIASPIEAPNKELAKQYMEMMLAKEGQAVFAKYQYDPIQ